MELLPRTACRSYAPPLASPPPPHRVICTAGPPLPRLPARCLWGCRGSEPGGSSLAPLQPSKPRTHHAMDEAVSQPSL